MVCLPVTFCWWRSSAAASLGKCLCPFNRRNPFSASRMAVPIQRRAILALRQRLTLRQTWRITAIMLSMALVQRIHPARAA